MPATPEALLSVVREVIEPLVRADGGRVYLVEAAAESVSLHLTGSYSGCPGNTLAQRRIIEPALRSVAPNIRVTVTSGAIVPEGALAVGE